MAYSEKGFGARISNAEDLLTHLKTFEGYAPQSEDLSIDALGKLITLIKGHGENAASVIDDYSEACNIREKLFSNKEPTSLQKLLSPINGAGVSAFGKDSKQLDNIMALTRKIRGTKLKKLGKNPDAETISESERSYGSMTQSLADLIVILGKHSDKYKPSNKNITVKALEELHQKIEKANGNVARTLNIQTKSRDQRVVFYNELNEITQRIKGEVKSQYTASSTEYKLIKSLKI